MAKIIYKSLLCCSIIIIIGVFTNTNYAASLKNYNDKEQNKGCYILSSVIKYDEGKFELCYCGNPSKELFKHTENKSLDAISKNTYNNIYEKYLKTQKEVENLKTQLGMEKKNNEELLADNISLQNTIKIAANIGVKPINYVNPPKVISRGYYQNNFQGEFTITAYTPCAEECGNNLGITSSGKPIVAGYCVAVDKRYWSMGTKFYIKGIGYVTAMDTGGLIKGRNRMDLAIFNKKLANAFGVRKMEVYLVKLGTGKIE